VGFRSSVLQERLNQVLMEKKKESSRSGMEIMNLLQVVFFMTSWLVGYTVPYWEAFVWWFGYLNLTERGTATWNMDWKKEWQWILQNDCKKFVQFWDADLVEYYSYFLTIFGAHSGWCIWGEEARIDARECWFKGTITFNAGNNNVTFVICL
jgi:hypothetical protein